MAMQVRRKTAYSTLVSHHPEKIANTRTWMILSNKLMEWSKLKNVYQERSASSRSALVITPKSTLR